MRKAGQTLVGKIIATIFFGALILSFAIWGIGDIFRAQAPTTVAQVGETEITVNQVSSAYTKAVQQLGRQFGTVITPDQARALGIDQQVVSNLVNEAVLSEKARELGLSVSDELVVRWIVENPAFRGADGQFNRALFDQALRNAGLSEAGFVQEQRAAMTRIHLAEALAAELPVPAAAREALHRYANERRAASYFVLTPTMAGEIPAPTAEQLQSFYDERRSSYMAPEYRALSAIAVDAAALAKPDAVSEADARQRYEQQKANYGSPERRTVQQITFSSQEEAQAAADRIQQGATFETIATERGLTAQSLELGTFTRAEMLDPAVADAAFSLAQGAVSNPVAGRFGAVLVRVTQIQPEAVRSFEEVAPQIRQEIAQERAREQIETIYYEIEDMRASARPLAEIAQEKGLPLIQIPAVSAVGQDKAGAPVSLPEQEAVVRAAFASDIGVDNEAVRMSNGGYVWFDVTGIEPSREKTLDEVRDQVTAQWREDQIAQHLSERARELTGRLASGEAIEAVAQSAGAPVKTATDLTRGTAKDDLSAEAVNRIFAVPAGNAGNAATGENARAVFRVTSATVPPMVTTTQEAERIETQLQNGMSDDLISQYIAQARQDLGVTINQQALRQATGGEF
ncbi:peptidylprolyl isomerase [Microvirga roseola]|uniref:peptidylprolyl isomerase n=1 Tax=Microvirga roseola TaxID=2883126 RepID=UPI001E62036E|nr:peptidylprolyl isomerase [Microvirga roseola]